MDADAFLWLITPLAAALATAVYMARRDFLQRCDHDERIRQIETVLAIHANSDQPEAPDVFSKVVEHAGTLATHGQTLNVHGERLDELEKEE